MYILYFFSIFIQEFLSSFEGRSLMTQYYNFVITDIPETERISKPPMVHSFQTNNGNFCNTFVNFHITLISILRRLHVMLMTNFPFAGKPVPILNEGNGCVVDVNVPVQPEGATKVHSPIVPIRLSDVFNQQVSQSDFVNLVVMNFSNFIGYFFYFTFCSTSVSHFIFNLRIPR